MSGALLQNPSTVSVRRTTEDDTGANVPPPRVIQPQPQNWLARFLRIKPAVTVMCFQVSKVRARKEVAGLFREWRRYGMRDIVIDKAAGRIWARVAGENCMSLSPPCHTYFQLPFPFIPHIRTRRQADWLTLICGNSITYPPCLPGRRVLHDT